MLNKLAFRNVKRSIKDYIIYLITITISFSLIFALNLISSSEAVVELSKGLDTFAYVLYFINAIVIFVICFLINYTTKFMFEKRSKEFGMYMLLGIKKKKISQMFLIENLLIGLLSLVLAIPIGFIVSQFMSMVIVSILGLPQAIFIELNMMSILLLLLYFAIIYVLVLFRANHRMKKINIHDLLYLEKQNEQKITKKKKHRNIIFVISLIIGIAGLVVWNSQWTLDNAGNQSTPNYLILSMALIIISIYGVMISVADFILAFILNNKNIKYKKHPGSTFRDVFYVVRKVLRFSDSMACIPEGFKAMVPAILILTFAWTLKAMTDSLGAAPFVASVMNSAAGGLMNLLPAIIFLVGCFLAFATGTSWGTFGILIPIVVAVFQGTNETMMIISISACMAGAVCGDHCSPISDTTIMASAGAQCNHVNHVSTQLPYAMTVAAVSCITYVIAGILQNAVICLVIGIALQIGVLLAIKAITKDHTGRVKTTN